MATWLLDAPDPDLLTDILAAYGCSCVVDGLTITVTHTSGRQAEALSTDGAIRAAVQLAKEG